MTPNERERRIEAAVSAMGCPSWRHDPARRAELAAALDAADKAVPMVSQADSERAFEQAMGLLVPRLERAEKERDDWKGVYENYRDDAEESIARAEAAARERRPIIALRHREGDLDDVVAKGVRMFRAETMDAKTLWMACYFDDAGDERLTFFVRSKRGRLIFDVTEVPSDYEDFDARSSP